MQHVLVYSDSLSWGVIPATRRRLPFDQRWPGVMEISLCSSGRMQHLALGKALSRVLEALLAKDARQAS